MVRRGLLGPARSGLAVAGLALVGALSLAGCSRSEGELRRCEALLGQPDQQESALVCEEVFRRHLALRRAEGDHAAASGIAYRLFYSAWAGSRYRQALEAAVAAAAESQAATDREGEQRAAQALFTVLFSLGDLEGAARALAAAGELLDPGQRRDRGYWLLNQAALSIESGRPALAIRDLEQALALAGEIDDPRFPRSVRLNLAEAYLALGAGDGIEVDFTLRSAGAYQVLLLASSEPLPEGSTGTLDGDAARALAAGARVELGEEIQAR